MWLYLIKRSDFVSCLHLSVIESSASVEEVLIDPVTYPSAAAAVDIAPAAVTSSTTTLHSLLHQAVIAPTAVNSKNMN